MKVCVTATAPGLEAHVDPRLEGAAFFTVVDTDKMTAESIPNKFRDEARGAEEDTAKACIDLGAEAIISDHIRPKAQEIISKAGMKIYPYSGGLVEDAVDQLKRGVLQTQSELSKTPYEPSGIGRGEGRGTGPEAFGQGYRSK